MRFIIYYGCKMYFLPKILLSEQYKKNWKEYSISTVDSLRVLLLLSCMSLTIKKVEKIVIITWPNNFLQTALIVPSLLIAFVFVTTTMVSSSWRGVIILKGIVK